MSMYSMVFGQNAAADLILATLGLTRAAVGRFRDAFVTDADEIAVYTRNGAGNRECGCCGDPEGGTPQCRHHVVVKDVPEYAFMAKADWPGGSAPSGIFTSRGGVFGCEYQTGQRVPRDHFVCEEPESMACGCVGCIVTHRLPGHALYLRDEDDDFDRTYCTVYFRLPDLHADDLRQLRSGSFDPNARWQAAIDALNGSVGGAA